MAKAKLTKEEMAKDPDYKYINRISKKIEALKGYYEMSYKQHKALFKKYGIILKTNNIANYEKVMKDIKEHKND